MEQQKQQQTAHLERTAAGIVTLSKLSGTTTDSRGSSAAADHERVSGQRGAKRSERSEDGTPEARDPAEGRTGEAVSRVPKKTPRAGHALALLLHSPRGIREPDCETDKSSRRESGS